MRRIVSCWFPMPAVGNKFDEMARVFEYTALKQCPDWTLSLTKLAMPARMLGKPDNHIANTWKLDHWVEQVHAAADGDEILLIDSDTMILRPLDPIWEQAFDIAYTARAAEYPHPLNGGVVFVRVSDRSRAFLEEWKRINRAMLNDRALRDLWRKYAGLNQRALGKMLNAKQQVAHIIQVPCLEWNCEDSEWKNFDPALTRIVHIKSGLRSAIFGPVRRPHHQPLIRIWETLRLEADGKVA